MALDIIINFEDTYEPVSIESNLTIMTFNAPQRDGNALLLTVSIAPINYSFLPNVYNLGFGPNDGIGGLDDNIRLKHADVNKVFSTVLFHALTYLQEHPNVTIGIDGSEDLRATLYHMMFKTNKEYLADFFIPIGVDWYVRVFRNGDYEKDEQGFSIAKPRPESFDFNRNRHDLYRYYMFRLKVVPVPIKIK